MTSLNRVEIIGHAGRDAETSYTPSGSAVCKFSVATSEKWKDKQTGEKKERTEWHSVQVWGQLAEICGERVHKGDLVYVSGSLRTNEWEDRDGAKKSRTEINADKVLFLRKPVQEGNPPAKRQSGFPLKDDDSIPF